MESKDNTLVIRAKVTDVEFIMNVSDIYFKYIVNKLVSLA